MVPHFFGSGIFEFPTKLSFHSLCALGVSAPGWTNPNKSWEPRALAELGLFDNPFLLSVNENILQTIDKFSLFRPDTQTTIAQIPMCKLQNNNDK